ncbi:hypothetical protein [Cysteiniphilum sp. SYW-8]|uniref:hypothetical protein n=1 Tax=Cysteiniphilum sp. SYW-8 TaxID=2610890 RepID=UPI000E34BD99|nr:hypothetical protein [Cysteiniphilum sp. SYW-8]
MAFIVAKKQGKFDRDIAQITKKQREISLCENRVKKIYLKPLPSKPYFILSPVISGQALFSLIGYFVGSCVVFLLKQ